MTDDPTEVSNHYTIPDLGRRILAALEAAGKDLESLTVEDLAPVDAFHIRGRTSTEELARWADLRPGHLLLDVGCGLGGTSRYLAAGIGCDVIGMDLTEEYCRVAGMLSERVGLRDRTGFHCGSALDMPFEDGAFDLAWTEHVQMNIPDKERFYGEMHRILRPEGRLAFHDIFQGEGGDPHFPVPWAGDPTISSLIAPDRLRKMLGRLGFDEIQWEEISDRALGWFREAAERAKTDGLPRLGIHLLMGGDARLKIQNVMRNLEEGRVVVARAVFLKRWQQ